MIGADDEAAQVRHDESDEPDRPGDRRGGAREHDRPGGDREARPAQALAQWVLPEFDMRAAMLRQRIAQAFEINAKLAASA